MSKENHKENCLDCKESIKKMLTATFGAVEVNWNLNIACRLEDYKNTNLYEIIEPIYQELQKHRGHNNFVRVKNLRPVDFFIPDQKLIVEFDESQHFTKPRDIALSLYPRDSLYGFCIQRWRRLCQELDRHDNDPPDRDEQRAWYDTLRDFAPICFLGRPTIRLYSRDFVWCSLDEKEESDVQTFKKLIGELDV